MIIDLRSDTVTRPTKGMLEAMMQARVGDDVFGEDEAIISLEKKAAQMFGMESGIFCPSGTMTNQIAIKVLSNPPGEMICDRLSHVYQYEGGGIAFNSGLSVNLPEGEKGILTAGLIEERINPPDVHKPETQLVSLENTCNRGGGSIYRPKQIEEIHNLCKKHGLRLHLDGARIFNAIVADKQEPKAYGKWFDTISVCLSKGLGAPVGSVLVGSKDTIERARRIRKILGGGMRQAGFLAAAGSYALDHHVDRLSEDHSLAREIEKMLQAQEYVTAVMPVETNIVVFTLKEGLSPSKFLSQLENHQIKAVAFGPQAIRFVTHLDVNKEMLNKLEVALKAVR